jgi:hypothetical protein
MSLDLDIQRLLRSAEVQEINFSMRGILVSGQGYMELSNCFSDRPMRHRIRVTIRPELVSHSAEAEYRPDTDKILLRSANSLQTPVSRAAVVHECTHAQCDLRARSTPIQNEEGAAFIAEAWYLLASNVSEADIDNALGQEIRTIAADLRAQRRPGAGPIELSADQINTVRRVMLQFGYAGGHYTSDGIRGRRYRGG